MKQIIASVFSDILPYTIGNIIFCIFKFLILKLEASDCAASKISAGAVFIGFSMIKH